MKRTMLLLFILLCITGTLGLAAQTEKTVPEEPRAAANAVSMDPIWILFNIYKFSYERRMAGQFSVMGEITYSPDFLWGLHEYSTLTYLDLIGKGRYYFGSHLKEAAADVDLPQYQKHFKRMFTDALGGLFVGGFVGYVNSVVEKGDEETFFHASFNGFGGGLELGCKYIFGEKKVSFFVEPYMLLRYYTGGYTYEDAGGNTIEKPLGFADGFDRNGFAGGVNFGITF